MIACAGNPDTHKLAEYKYAVCRARWVSPVYAWCSFVSRTRDFCGFARAVGTEFRTLVPGTNVTTNERGWDSISATANRQRYFDFGKRISQTNFQTAGVSVDALTSQIQSCGLGDSSGFIRRREHRQEELLSSP